MAHYPPILIVDEDDQPIGKASMDEAQAKGLFHRVVSIMVEDPSGKEILLQKRSKNAKTYPDTWDISAAGHVDAGEDNITAARRELREELGLSGLALKEIAKVKDKDVFEGRKLYRFNIMYKATAPKNTPLKLQTAELSTTHWINIKRLKELMSERPEKFAKGLFLFMEAIYN